MCTNCVGVCIGSTVDEPVWEWVSVLAACEVFFF